MAVCPGHYDGAIWFLTAIDSEKVEEIAHDDHVNVTYVDPSSNKFVSICGSASIIDDQAKREEMWTPMAKIWFTGPDDPNLAVMRVEIRGAEYWNAPQRAMITMFNNLDIPYTGEVADLGENRQMRLTDKQFVSAESLSRGTGTFQNE